MKRFHLLLLIIFFIQGYKASAQNDIDKDSIKVFTQQLINGIADGDTTAWGKYLDDSCIITSEDGSVKTKEQFIQGITTCKILLKEKKRFQTPYSEAV